MIAAVIVVEDGVEVALRAVREDRRDGGRGRGGARRPSRPPARPRRRSTRRWRTGWPPGCGHAQTASAGATQCTSSNAVVVDVAGVDARTEAAHQAGAGGLAEDGRPDGVHPDQPQVRVQLAAAPGRPRRSARRCRPSTPGRRRGRVGRPVPGPAPGRRRRCRGCCTGRDSRPRGPRPAVARPGHSGPAASRRSGWGSVDLVDLHAVGGQHPGDDRLQPGVGDHGDRVAVDHAGQCQAQTERAAAGLDDPAPRGAGHRGHGRRLTMCRAVRSLMPPGLKPSSLAQNPRPPSAKGSVTRSTGVLPTVAARVPAWS